MKKEYAVYIYRDRDSGEALYIGCTSSTKSRDYMHKKKDWYKKSGGMIIMRKLLNRAEVEDLESFLIKKLNPLFNIKKKHNSSQNKVYQKRRLAFEKKRKEQIKSIEDTIKRAHSNIERSKYDIKVYTKMLNQLLENNKLLLNFDN